MSDNFNDFEAEGPEAGGPGDDLWREDKENLEKALNECLEVFSAPAQPDSEKAFEALEVLDEVHPYFSDAMISNQIGELIELLQMVCDERILSSDDVAEGKQTIQELAESLEIHLSFLD